jgi:outer membrane protein assembly factor BamB
MLSPVEEADMRAFSARRWVTTGVVFVSLAATIAPTAAAARSTARVAVRRRRSGAGPDVLSMTGFSPASGPVGTPVTITGSGFVAGDIVQFNGTTAPAVKVNSAGTRLHAPVPAFATSGPITVTDPTTGQTVGLAGTAFAITTGVFASPNRVWAGGTLTFAGSGLSPDRDEPIFLGRVRLGSVVTDSHGDFQLGLDVPWDVQSGRLSIYALDPNVGKVLTILFVLGAWPTYRHDVAHTGYDDYETSVSPSNVAHLKQLWTKSTDPSGYFGMSPSVSDGLVYEGVNQYATSGCANVYAWTTNGKTSPWFSGLGCGYQLGPAPAEAGGALYYVSSASLLAIEVSARDAVSGAVLWDQSIPSNNQPVRSAPAVANGRLFEGSGDGNLYALDASNGSQLWSFPTGGPVNSSPAVAGGIVYVGSDSGTLFAIKAATGKKVWSATFGGAVESSPAVSGGVVYVGADDGSVAAFNAATGAPVWSRTFNGRTFRTSPAVANGIVYIGGEKGAGSTFFALDAATGATNWSLGSSPGVTDAAVANGVVYYAITGDHVVLALDAVSGVILWATNVAASPLAPIVANGEVYVESGSNIWAFSL